MIEKQHADHYEYKDETLLQAGKPSPFLGEEKLELSMNSMK